MWAALWLWGELGLASPVTAAPGAEEAQAPAQEAPAGETTVTAPAAPRQLPEERATAVVTKADLDRRLPRSAPDALRYESGVFIQQTAHGQGSAFIRGLTGQQTLVLFDGIRLNNGTYRQGPNQYFFTLDSRSIESIEVLRGGASTRHGSDALGGVILAHPLEPLGGEGPYLRPHLTARAGSADEELGGRLELDAAVGPALAALAGLGARRVGQLESAGPVLNPLDGALPEVPRFEADGRTQRGTGFKELTADGRLVLQPRPGHRLTLAGYAYRQYDSPRTDQCPPPGARFDECLLYEEQFRTLVYAAWAGELGDLARQGRATLSWQQQHERRRNDRPASFTYGIGRDDVDTLGLTASAMTAPLALGKSAAARLTYGADTYWDLVRSKAWVGFTDSGAVVERSRGQYLDGSTYLYGGAFTDAELSLGAMTLRGGGRASWIAARAAADPESGSQAVRRAWFPLVGHAGLEWRLGPALEVLANLDRSFRAPNLDDLTSRQQTGPGFQFENAALEPEVATTLEVGARARSPGISAELWAFRTILDGAVLKQAREAADCPPDALSCRSSWSRFQLVNAPSASELRGLEGSLKARVSPGLEARAGASWTWGEGPNVAERPSDPELPYQERVPLSRIPPLNGTVELGYRHPSGLMVGAALRWAALQDRLAVADRSDARIPLGGTPGFVVLDARAAYRVDRALSISVIVENLLDTPYRYHGSSVNGAGRGVLVAVEWRPFAHAGAISNREVSP